jgi:chaperonin GroES
VICNLKRCFKIKGGKMKKIYIIPLGDRVIIKSLEPKEVKKSGIIIPETAKERPQEGEIIAAGKGRTEKGKLIPIEMKVGDKVLYGKYSGTEIKINDEDYLILKEEDVLGIINKENI